MTERDFPALRRAVHESVIGQTFTQLDTALRSAIDHAAATRLVRTNATTFRGVTASETIRLSAIALLTACLATWAFSQFVPLYVSTVIPGGAFLLLALACCAAAAGANAIGEQWSRSRMRRVTTWLRGA